MTTQIEGLNRLQQLLDFVTNADKNLSFGMGGEVLKLFAIWRNRKDKIDGETFSEYVSPILDKFIELYNDATNKEELKGLHVPAQAGIIELAHMPIYMAALRVIGTDRSPAMLRKVYKDNRSNALGQESLALKAVA